MDLGFLAHWGHSEKGAAIVIISSLLPTLPTLAKTNHFKLPVTPSPASTPYMCIAHILESPSKGQLMSSQFKCSSSSRDLSLTPFLN